MTRDIWLGLGANIGGKWGTPERALQRAVREIEASGLSVFARSSLYVTQPMGSQRQPKFRNAVVGVRGSIAPAALLRLVKRLEARAGRRSGSRWGPRPLDIDVLDFGGRRIGRGNDTAAARGRLRLPHPGIADRGFVLVPLAEAAPGWRHPTVQVRAITLLRRKRGLGRGIVALPDPVWTGTVADTFFSQR